MNDGIYLSKTEILLAIVEKGQSSRRYKLGETWELNFEEIREALDDVPAAYVRPVVRGEWIEENYGYARCSICQCDTNNRDSEGFPIGADENHERAKFCPHCGAEMETRDG